MAPDFLPHAFDRFRQSDGSTTRLHAGLGLGLAIARELTELHGGHISASSAGPGQGSTFRVVLPRLVTPDDQADLRRPLARRLDGRTVLVVDDDTDSRDLARVV